MAGVGRPLSGGGADKDQSKMFRKLVRKFFQRVRPFVKPRVSQRSSLARPPSSLRATGSRERAPDDRLREAVHGAA